MMKIRINIQILTLAGALLIAAEPSQCQLFMWQKKKEFIKKMKEADFYFNYDNFQLALPVLLELYETDSLNTEVNFKTAVSIFHSKRDKTEAVPYFEKAKQDYQDAYFYLGILYHHLIHFDKALEYFNNYRNATGSKTFTNKEIDYYMDQCYNAKYFMSKRSSVTIENMDEVINSSYPDYVPVITSDESVLIFTSRREGSTGGEKDPNQEYFEDIYQSVKKDGLWTAPQNMGSPINTATHDACISLSSDGHILFIYRTDKELTGGDIYLSTLKDGLWSEPEKLPETINSSGLETHASLSPTEQALYFSSDRPGGYGGKDIYIVQKLPGGEWSLPKNIGPAVNTPYDEDAPFIHPDGSTLYFSSKGHRNMGGYDIFKTEKNNDHIWTVPENLGYPINTVFDDIYFVVSASGKRGYYSSDRDGGFGYNDLYTIDMPDFELNRILLKGTVTTNEPVFQTLPATITIIDYQTKELQGIYRTQKNTGKYLLVLLPKKRYKMIIESEGYYSIVDEINMTERLRLEDLFKNISMKKIQAEIIPGQDKEDEEIPETEDESENDGNKTENNR